MVPWDHETVYLVAVCPKIIIQLPSTGKNIILGAIAESFFFWNSGVADYKFC